MIAHQLVIEDVDELAYSVSPWQLRMAQLSPGKLDATMQVCALGDILISSERWTRKIAASGRTPPGYLVLAGPINGRGFNWCGGDTEHQRLACSVDEREVDFITWDEEFHWVLLVPLETLRNQLGEETTHSLCRLPSSIHVDPALSQSLCDAIFATLNPSSALGASIAHSEFMEAARNRLLAAVSRLLLALETTQVATEKATTRTRAYQRARILLENTERPIPVEELAGKVGVTRRCLEIGFKEVAGVSPKTFMQRSLLNRLHRELLHADPAYHNVTNIALNFGFAELGRTAGRYRELFGELPSKTLASNAQSRGVRYKDLLDI